MSNPDLYAVLGVSADATAEELSCAYRRRARLTHPDAGGDPLAFRAVRHAFEILSDPGLRAGYDAERRGSPSAGRATTTSSRPRHRPAGHPTPPPQSTSSDRDLDLGQIAWAQPFLELERRRIRDGVRMVPGERWWLVRLGNWLVIVIWVLAAVWIGLERISPTFGRAGWVLGWWVLGWWVCAAVVVVHAIRGKWSVLIAVCAVWRCPPTPTLDGSGPGSCLRGSGRGRRADYPGRSREADVVGEAGPGRQCVR